MAESKPIKLKCGRDTSNDIPMDHEWYSAIFKNANITEGKFGELLFLQFELRSGVLEDGETSAKGAQVAAMCAADLSPNNKTYDLIKSIAGRDFEEDEEVELDTYYGNKYKVFIEVKKAKDKTRVNVTKVKTITTSSSGETARKKKKKKASS